MRVMKPHLESGSNQCPGSAHFGIFASLSLELQVSSFSANDQDCTLWGTATSSTCTSSSSYFLDKSFCHFLCITLLAFWIPTKNMNGLLTLNTRVCISYFLQTNMTGAIHCYNRLCQVVICLVDEDHFCGVVDHRFVETFLLCDGRYVLVMNKAKDRVKRRVLLLSGLLTKHGTLSEFPLVK